MPITSIYWARNTPDDITASRGQSTRGQDIHVLRGQSTPDLRHGSFKFRRDTDHTHDLFADDYINQFADVTLKFTPLFKGTQQGDSFTGDNNGITFNTTTGSAAIAAGVPANRKNNFIIEVEAKNNADGTTFTETIRVQIHGAVSQVWLTPGQLTVRPVGPPGAIIHTAYRFAVRAQFDDGLVGDVTDGHGVTWDPSGGHVDQNGKIQILPSDNPGDNLFVSATLPAALGGASTAVGPTLSIAHRWSDEPTPPQFTLVAAGGGPAAGTLEQTANVLMLGDGFRAADKDAFDQIVDSFVQFLKTNQLTKPFNLFSPKMNFWKIFFPAQNVGISFRSEMFIIGIDQYAHPIPAAVKPNPDPSPTQPTPWDIRNLVYEVGLPVPGDDAAARTPAILRDEWRKLLTGDPAPHLPNDNVINTWKLMTKRAFIEEQDCFPGMSLGSVPAADLDDTTELGLHGDRAGLQLLRAVCATLDSDDGTKLSDGRPIGALWAADEAGFRYLNRDLIALISSTPGGRAVNWPSPTQGRYLAVDTGGRYLDFQDPLHSVAYIPVKRVPDKNSYALNVAAVASDVTASASNILAHELGHSLGLGDEYAEIFTRFTQPHADPSHANLQTEADTQIQDPQNPANRIISGDQIQWNWHRIVAAAVVDQGAITAPAPNKFRIPVIPDVSFRFAQGDTVLLRQRRWKTPLHKFTSTDVSPALQIADPPESGAIVVTPAQGVQISLADIQAFLPGSLIYTPKPAPKSVLSAAYPFAEMVAKNVKDAITSSKKPLTDVPCVFEVGTQLPILDDVANIRAGIDLPSVVGLYAGGARHPCGIFHPTGQCMMRQQPNSHSEFCPVCRYIMVDLIAPEFHPEIDADYDTNYPQE